LDGVQVKKKIAFVLIGIAVVLFLHHWYAEGYPFAWNTILCHAFFAALCIGAAAALMLT
jgi:hypothetical protein